jgi:hypothetical protein
MKVTETMKSAKQFNHAIGTLRAEALEAGDLMMVLTCDLALGGRNDADTRQAREECARVMADAAAQV